MDYDEDKKRWIISYGIADCEGAIGFMDANVVDELLGDAIDGENTKLLSTLFSPLSVHND